MMNSYSVAAARHPFGMNSRWAMAINEGKTIHELVEMVPDHVFPIFLRPSLVVQINGHTVPRHLWKHVRPKTNGEIPVAVTIGLPVSGGGGGKDILAAVASIAILAVAIFAAPLVAGAFYSAGTFGYKLVASAVLAAGTTAAALAASAISAPPAAQARPAATNEEAEPELGSAFANGNILQPDGPIPIVLGRRKVFPPFACQPLVEIAGNDEIIEVVYVLNGPHDLQNVKINDVDIGDIEGISYEIIEGFDDDPPISIVRRYADTQSVNAELIKHSVDPENPDRIESSTNPTESLPVWQRFVSSVDPDQIWLAFSWGQGLVDAEDTTLDVAVPVRFRMRRKGTTEWTNLPEVHFTGQTIRTYRKQIKLIWQESATTPPTPPTRDGPYIAFRNATGQDGSTASPATDDWTANDHFGTSGLEATQNFALSADGVVFYLNEANFPRGYQYEVEVKMGALYTKSNFNTSNYQYSGVVLDFFWHNSNVLPRSLDNVSYNLTVTRFSSVYSDNPIQKPGLSTIAIVGKNITVESVSVEAARYVGDWNGEDWSTPVATSNPAPHFRDILNGDLTVPRKRIPTAEIDDANLLSWRSYCTANNIEISSVVDGASMGEVLTAIASTAYARPLRSSNYGVIIDRDRTAEAPIQVFTPRNSSGFGWSKTFSDIPDAYRVSFTDAAENWVKRQILVSRPGVPLDQAELIETLTYDTLTNEELIRDRAIFDLRQLQLRNTTYSLEVDIENLVCQRGSLIAVSNDELVAQSAWARIVSIVRDGSNFITSVTLDASLDAPTTLGVYDVADVYSVADIWIQGIDYGAVARTADGTIKSMGGVSASDSTTVNLDVAYDDNQEIQVGDLIVIGPTQTVYHRMIITNIKARSDLKATLVMVDEAPELHS